jgi:2-amino-4-hydroxy-6-hydroxymethyldihydropteridine diphosphokinase
VSASLADQAGGPAPGRSAGLAIALGANLPSPAGPPLATLLAVRPLLETLLRGLVAAREAAVHWSPLFRTAPVGGPPGQPDYLNAAVLLSPAEPPTPAAALELLKGLQGLEQRFARRRHQHWGPRSLDLDLLWWGDLRSRSQALALPHPRLQERSFVLAPLAAIDPALVPPGADAAAAALLARLEAAGSEPAPERLAGRPGWPEGAQAANA